MIDVSLLDAMSQAGWSYDEASHGFTHDGEMWVSWQQARELLDAAECGREVTALEVEPTRREVAEMVQRVANDG